MEGKELKELLSELLTKRNQAKEELDSLTFKFDFSSVDALIAGYEQTEERKQKLQSRLQTLEHIEALLSSEIEKAEFEKKAKDHAKKIEILKRREQATLKTLAENDLDPLSEMRELELLAIYRKQQREGVN